MTAEPLTSLRPRHWVTLDVLAAAVLALLLVNGVIRSGHLAIAPTAPAVVGFMLVAIAAIGVGARRFHPTAVLAVVALASLTEFALGYERDPAVAVALVLYTVVVSEPLRTAVMALLLVESGVAIASVVTPVPTYDQPSTWAVRFSDVVTVASVQMAAWAIGLAVRRQRAYVLGLRERAQREVEAQRELTWRAVTEERLRIARELHDVVAHSMSVIAVQAGVGNFVDDDQPRRARDALSAIETTSREALREMRRLLGVLRDESPSDLPALLPAPGLVDLKALIERTADTGLQTDLRVVGDACVLPSGIELAAYRIAQEALTNVIKHARTDRCRVIVTYGDDSIEVEVTDDGVGAAAPRSDGGHGIIGMRERASLYGGELTAGPLPVRGYRVAARLPIAGPDP